MSEYVEHATGDLWFHKDTPPKVAEVIHAAYCQRNLPEGRVRIWCGDVKTGRAWEEEYDVTGTVGRTTGAWKVPILVARAGALDGQEIPTAHIVRISCTDGRTLYKHPKFHTGLEQAYVNVDNVVCLPGGAVHAGGFKSRESAQRWLDFMNGKRFNK